MDLRALALALAVAGPALAAAGPPEPDGTNVLVVNDLRVSVPAQLPGRCRVQGRVLEVRAGSAFRPGEAVDIAVPCGLRDRAQQLERRPATPLPPEMAPALADPEVLSRSRLGFAYLDDGGRLIWRPSAGVYAPWGRIWGYRVLDGVYLPAHPGSV